MSIRIRFKKIGRKGIKCYRVVISDKTFKRDGKVLDTIGFYNPNTQPPQVKIDKVSLQNWISKGAIISESLRKIISL